MLGIELSYWIFLVEYVILVPFQTVINRYNWSVTKMSTYIRVFYEKDIEDLNWESLHMYYDYIDYYRKFNNSISGVIRCTGVTQLGFLATSFYVVFSLYDNYIDGTFCLNSMDIILIIIAFSLFFITIGLNKEYNKNYNEQLENVIQRYKDSLKK